MTRKVFMETLERMLSDVSFNDRYDALSYYKEYFDDFFKNQTKENCRSKSFVFYHYANCGCNTAYDLVRIFSIYKLA